MERMRMLAGLGKVSSRWDAPDTPRWQRHAFGAVLLAWLVIAVACVYALVSWKISALTVLVIACFSGAAVGPLLRHRWDVRHPRETTQLRPSQPSDTDSNPWMDPAG